MLSISKRHLLPLSLFGLLTACTTTPVLTPPATTTPKAKPDIYVEQKPTVIIEPSKPATPAEPINEIIVPKSPARIETARSDAVTSLLATAKQLEQQQDYQAAQSTLQRAQRISPRDPEIYYQLANIHIDLQDYRLAEQVALKGVSTAQGQANQLRRLWLLLADIYSETGDSAKANNAFNKASQY